MPKRKNEFIRKEFNRHKEVKWAKKNGRRLRVSLEAIADDIGVAKSTVGTMCREVGIERLPVGRHDRVDVIRQPIPLVIGWRSELLAGWGR